jgi:hypothetical protein
MSSTKQWQPDHRHFTFHANWNEEFILKIPFASVYADPIFIFRSKPGPYGPGFLKYNGGDLQVVQTFCREGE